PIGPVKAGTLPIGLAPAAFGTRPTDEPGLEATPLAPVYADATLSETPVVVYIAGIIPPPAPTPPPPWNIIGDGIPWSPSMTHCRALSWVPSLVLSFS